MRTRYISSPLAPDGHMAAPLLRDPLFLPLFSGLLGGFGSITIVGNLTVAGLASAIAAGGGYKEFKCQL